METAFKTIFFLGGKKVSRDCLKKYLCTHGSTENDSKRQVPAAQVCAELVWCCKAAAHIKQKKEKMESL